MVNIKIDLQVEGTVLGNNMALLNQVIKSKAVSLEDIALLLSDSFDMYNTTFRISHTTENMDSSYTRTGHELSSTTEARRTITIHIRDGI